MRPSMVLGILALGRAATAEASVQGLYDLVERHLPAHSRNFTFVLEQDVSQSNGSGLANDKYSIFELNRSITIQGNTLSALSTGLRRYFTDVAHVDMYWFIGSRLDQIASPLPMPNRTITGESIVPWRYFFNTVTFSYTTAFWTWPDWELELDWLALHGVNLPLAWVGFEKILLDVFREIGLTDSEIIPFFSGPAFQAWNRFGNIQGSWGGELPPEWIDGQFQLQKQILARMLELGMTPILPAFTGFVPRALPHLYPNASVVNSSRWGNVFTIEYSSPTFLQPQDPLFADLQSRVISKQIEYYGNITPFYTLDQYNENDPFSGDLDYLREVTHGTWQSLKSANPAAVWVMQGWLFYAKRDFWTEERIEAYLSGVEENSDMIILDLFSESAPQWQRTKSYYGKPWIWNELHDYGGSLGLYGQINNVTINPIEALSNSSSLVGFGLTPEGQEGNEIIYTLLLDQAWSTIPIDTEAYFASWVRSRYAGNNTIPESLYTAWEYLRISAYNNMDLTKGYAVPKAIFELAPNITGLANVVGFGSTAINYNTSDVVEAWKNMEAAAKQDIGLWDNIAFQYDFVDVTRQIFANAFLSDYETLISTWNTTDRSDNTEHVELLRRQANSLTTILRAVDTVLSTLPQFSLAPWIESARSWAGNDSALADFYEYNARNQITLWGPNGDINDYASKSWGGLVGEYYLPRWEAFLEYLESTTPETYDDNEARARVKIIEQGFQTPGTGVKHEREKASLREIVQAVATIVVPTLRETNVV